MSLSWVFQSFQPVHLLIVDRIKQIADLKRSIGKSFTLYLDVSLKYEQGKVNYQSHSSRLEQS
jgi:hypothetical protein